MLGWGDGSPINFVRLIVLSSFRTFNLRQSLGICSLEYDEKKAVVKVRRHIFIQEEWVHSQRPQPDVYVYVQTNIQSFFQKRTKIHVLLSGSVVVYEAEGRSIWEARSSKGS